MELKDFNTDTIEGQYFMAAMAVLTTDLWPNKTPEEVIEKLEVLRKKMYEKMQAIEGVRDFPKELASTLNRYSKENGSNTPDFILAEYMIGCLEVFNKASRGREKWYGKELSITEDTVYVSGPQLTPPE